MPLCPQITNTPITVTQTADFTVSSVLPVVAATTTQVEDVVVLVDGKTKAYYQATAPTSGMTEGDIWFDTDDGYKLYYYTGSAWTSVQDTAIAAAQSAATAAQTTADGKNKIYRQGTTPTGTFSVGDLWFNTSSDNAISRWDGSTWVLNTLGNNALASISANKITAGTIDASVITVSNINAGNISTGTLAAARIAANSLDASKITAGTITATQISSSYVYAGTIAAGNITTGTLSATVSLAAVSGTIGGFTLASTYLSGAGGFTLYANGTIDGGSANTIFYGKGNFGGGTAGSETLIVTGTSNFNGTLTGLAITANGSMTANAELFAAGHQTTTNTANGFIFTTGGRIARSTASSERYKENIVDLSQVPELDPKKLLNLPVRAFTYKDGEVPESDDRYKQLIPGFIAEEVDAIYPVAADYVDGPESWNDRMIVPALLSLVQDLYKEVQTLKGE
jgi:hypothetical protein